MRAASEDLSRTLLGPATLVLMLWIGSGTVGAQQMSPEYDRCMNDSGGVTSAMLDCIGAELAAEDRGLNDTWARLPARIDPDQMTAVREAQRAWIAFRNAECAAQAALAGGGSLSGVVYSGCVLDMTSDRRSVLADLGS